MKTFAEFLPRFELGIDRFLNGDATLWKSNASQEVDGTIMGPGATTMSKTAPAAVLNV